MSLKQKLCYSVHDQMVNVPGIIHNHGDAWIRYKAWNGDNTKKESMISMQSQICLNSNTAIIKKHHTITQR